MAGGQSDEPIWDGNGGTLDPRKATQRDMLIALHVKMDNVVLPMIERHDAWIQARASGDLTPAIERAVLSVVQKDRDAVLERKSFKAPVLAAFIAVIALALMAVQTVYLAGGMG